MPKTNSESDFGGSLTSDDEDLDAGPSSPVAASRPTGQSFELPTAAEPPNPKITLDTDKYDNPSSHYPTSPTKLQRSRSLRMPPLNNGSSAESTLRGIDLFRATARKIMQMRKTSSMLGAFRAVGAEPGVDPRRASAVASYGHIREKCVIEVVDYNSVRNKTYQYNNEEFIDLLTSNGTSREPWVKVRWICIGGISWDVLSTLSLTYDLHPLSLEDVLHQRGHARSKADYFSRHLFLRVLCHSLGGPDDINNHKNIAHVPMMTHITTLPRSHSPVGLYDEKVPDGPGDDKGSSEKSVSGLFQRKKSSIAERKLMARDLEVGPQQGVLQQVKSQAEAEAIATIDTLKAGERVNVNIQNLFIFLLRDGTLVSIHQTPTSEFAAPIMRRLRARDTILRMTADPSLLVHSILDLVVDQAMHVVEEYHRKIIKLEHEILLKPKMRSVRHLHILSGDLTLHKRTLDPLRALVYGLRRYDLDRCVAVAASAADETSEGDAKSRKVVGYMSHKAKVYLADVHDHVEYILSSLDMFASISENLINYTFNMASWEMNEVMRRLTLATIIFLPLTLLTGYFGMNFEFEWSVKSHSDVFFWEVALPLMVFVIGAFMWNDIIRAKHFTEKKMMIKRIFRNSA